MSVHMPEHYKCLLAGQEQCTATIQSWWPVDGLPAPSPTPIVLGPGGADASCPINLQDDISAAIAAPLEPPPISAPHAALKTSNSHPIK